MGDVRDRGPPPRVGGRRPSGQLSWPVRRTGAEGSVGRAGAGVVLTIRSQFARRCRTQWGQDVARSLGGRPGSVGDGTAGSGRGEGVRRTGRVLGGVVLALVVFAGTAGAASPGNLPSPKADSAAPVFPAGVPVARVDTWLGKALSVRRDALTADVASVAAACGAQLPGPRRARRDHPGRPDRHCGARDGAPRRPDASTAADGGGRDGP